MSKGRTSLLTPSSPRQPQAAPYLDVEFSVYLELSVEEHPTLWW